MKPAGFSPEASTFFTEVSKDWFYGLPRILHVSSCYQLQSLQKVGGGGVVVISSRKSIPTHQ